MRGKMKGEHERTLILAHQTAALSSLAMAGKLKPVGHYLKAASKKPKEGGAAVLAMMRRLAKKQKG